MKIAFQCQTLHVPYIIQHNEIKHLLEWTWRSNGKRKEKQWTDCETLSRCHCSVIVTYTTVTWIILHRQQEATTVKSWVYFSSLQTLLLYCPVFAIHNMRYVQTDDTLWKDVSETFLHSEGVLEEKPKVLYKPILLLTNHTPF